MTYKQRKAACIGAFLNLWREKESSNRTNGLRVNLTLCKCIFSTSRGKMPLPRSMTGCRFSSLKLGRRTIAAPLRGVFLMAVVPTYGVIALSFCTGAPRGTPSGVLFPIEQSANPRGAVHLLAGVNGSNNLSIGARYEH